jgi:ADP-heptose:LPS heptosyltransferase
MLPQAGRLPLPDCLNSVLLISLQRLGDIALEIPSLQRLRQSYPEAFLGVVAPTAFHPLIQLACRPQLLIDYPRNAAGLFNTASVLRKRNWQVAVDLTTDYHLAPAWLIASSGAPIRIGFENAGRGHFFNYSLPVPDDVHMQDLFRKPIELLGVSSLEVVWVIQIAHPCLPLPAKKGNQRYVGIHPGATHWTQRWPPPYFAVLARKIHEAGDCCLILGSPADQALVQEIASSSGHVAIPMITGNNVLSFAAVMSRMDLLICNNSGPLHLAGLLGVPTLSFMGPTVKARWWPRGSRQEVMRRDQLPCIGCNNGYCRIQSHACMTEITPDQAFQVYQKCY